jgi:hypothetical protein
MNGLCLWHDPERIEAATLARRRGALKSNSKRPKSVKVVLGEEAPPSPQSLADCVTWASWLAVAVTTGKIDGRTCREATTAIRELRSSLEKRDVEKAFDELKKEIAALRKPRIA